MIHHLNNLLDAPTKFTNSSTKVDGWQGVPYVTSTFDTSLKSRIPLGEEESNVSLCVRLCTNSAMNLSSGVVTLGVSAQASRQRRMVEKCAGYSQSNSMPGWGKCHW